MASNQFGAGNNLWKSHKHYTLREMTRRKVLKFNTTGIDYHLTLKPQSNGEPLIDQLGGIFDSMVNDMTTGMADNDLVRFVLQSKSLDYPISLPFMPRHELNAERIMGEVQRVLQSNENVNLQDGMQVHLVHVGMPQGGVASRKRKHYGFKLSKFLEIMICCVLLVLWLQTWLDKRNILTGTLFVRDVNGKESWLKSYIRRRAFQRVSVAFQRSRSSSKLSKITRSLSYPLNTLMPLSLKDPRERNKFICIFAIITTMS